MTLIRELDHSDCRGLDSPQLHSHGDSLKR
jgi:hypothetical protein